VQLKPLILGSDRISEAGSNDRLATNNFSYRQIDSGEQVTVHSDQQMLVNNSVRVDGEFRVDGEAFVFESPQPQTLPTIPGDNYSHFEVLTQKQIPSGQEMILSAFVRIESELQVDGQMTILGSVEEETSTVIPFRISAGKTFNIAQDFEHYFREFVSIAGGLKVSGQFAVGA
jgi:hypothetical protein